MPRAKLPLSKRFARSGLLLLGASAVLLGTVLLPSTGYSNAPGPGAPGPGASPIPIPIHTPVPQDRRPQGAAPRALTGIANDSFKVTLAWLPVASALTYRIFRSVPTTSALPVVFTVRRQRDPKGAHAKGGTSETPIQFVDTSSLPDTTYAYVVEAGFDNSLIPGRSAPVSVTTPLAPLVSGLAAKRSGVRTIQKDSYRVELSWDPVPRAARYRVWAGQGLPAIATVPAISGLGARCLYTEEAVVPGSARFYQIVPIFELGSETREAEQAKAPGIVLDFPIPVIDARPPGTAPVNLSATAKGTAVVLGWGDSAAATHVRVYRASSASGPYAVVHDEAVTPAPHLEATPTPINPSRASPGETKPAAGALKPVTRTFTDSQVAPAATYFYKVEDFYPDAARLGPAASPSVSATLAPRPPLTGLVGQGSLLRADLHWTPQKDAAGYFIYRDSVWIASIYGEPPMASYTDRLTAARAYTYQVLPHYSFGDPELEKADLPRQPRVSVTVTPRTIRGFADLHTHQFGNLAFGGNAVIGSPYGRASTALADCGGLLQHGQAGKDDVMGNAIRAKEIGAVIAPLHATAGYPSFVGWPSWSSVSHQQMWEQWLLRAHLGGLQLMVMHAVNNRSFCTKANIAPGRTCDDAEAVRVQLDAAKQMQAAVDKDNHGYGWYRIVYSPEEARVAIANGQLAVVLGVEVDDAFTQCSGTLCQDQVDAYYAMGVRHLFPIHFKDNAVGGAAYDKDLTTPRGYKGVNLAMESQALALAQYSIDARDCKPTYRFRGGFCNALGLTPAGKDIIRAMMRRGMIIDVDHMSELASNATLDLTEANGYPVVSGHTGFSELAANAPNPDKSNEANMTAARLERIRRSGGMANVIANQGNLEQIGTWAQGPITIKHTCGSSSETLAQAYLYAITKTPGMPVGISTDMNAFLTMPSPRFGGDACNGGKSNEQGKVQQNRVKYPFIAIATGTELKMERAVANDPQVIKDFDFNVDGLANIGLLPDLVEDFRQLGMRDVDLEPLLSSAEGYVRVWEQAERNRLQDLGCNYAAGCDGT